MSMAAHTWVIEVMVNIETPEWQAEVQADVGGNLAGCSSLRACAELASALSQPQRRTLRLWQNPKSGWPYTKVACRITRNRKTVRKNIVVNESEETVFFVGSMSSDSRSPAEFLNLSRGHWIIENGLHYHKDRSPDEDRNSAAEQKSGRVMCFLRSITALILGKAKEPLNVVKMRLALNLRLLMGLLSGDELSQWLKRYQPFTPQ